MKQEKRGKYSKKLNFQEIIKFWKVTLPDTIDEIAKIMASDLAAMTAFPKYLVKSHKKLFFSLNFRFEIQNFWPDTRTHMRRTRQNTRTELRAYLAEPLQLLSNSSKTARAALSAVLSKGAWNTLDNK